MRKYDRMMTETSIDSELEFYENEELTEKSLAEEETNGPETRNGTIFGKNSLFVKVRKEPNVESEIVDLLGKGDIVTIIGETNGFYKVIIPNKIGYTLKELIKEA